MLGTAEQLAAGLGAHPKAPPKSSDDSTPKKASGAGGDGVGNAHLRLWIGERCLGESLLSLYWLRIRIDMHVFLSSLQNSSAVQEMKQAR